MTLRTKYTKSSYIIIFCLLLSFLMLFFSKEIKSGVIYGLDVSYNTIIPTLFPFFVLSDYWACFLNISSHSFPGKIFRKAFGINGSAISAFLCGMFCGFPLGVKASVDCYKNGGIDHDELQLLCALACNPSCAFVISGIGLGMYGSIRIGLLLYFCIISSAVFVGILLRIKSKKTPFYDVISRQSFNIVESVKNAGLSSITVCSYIIFFSAILGLWRSICKITPLNIIFSCLTEITAACLLIKEISPSPSPISFGCTAFALGFSGFSVHMQTFSFMPGKISRPKYLITRLLIGAFSGVSAFILFTILKAVAL